MSFDNSDDISLGDFKAEGCQADEGNASTDFNQIELSNQPQVHFIDIFQQDYHRNSSNSYPNSEFDIILQETIINLPPKVKKNALLLFIDNPNSRMKVGKRRSLSPRKKPKKSYFRMKLIRRFIKSLYVFFHKKDDPANMFADDYNEFLSENGNRLKYTIEVEFGIKLSRNSELPSNRSNMNDTFCKKFFSGSKVFEGFKIFLEKLFSDSEENLCKMFQFDCCKDLKHHLGCANKWKILKHWSMNSLVKFEA